MSGEQICPVCDKPVGSKPHDECLDQRLAETSQEENHDRFPCPACGSLMSESMECSNSDCELSAPK